MSAHILVVDDESGIRELLDEILRDEGYRVTLAENATAARAARNAERPDMVLLDIWMPDTDGVTLLREWARGGQLDMPVVMMSGHATIDTAVEATRIGAADFLEKPVALARLLETVRTQLQRSIGGEGDLLSRLCAVSPAFTRARERLNGLLGGETSVLLVGVPGGAFDAFLPLLRRPQLAWVGIDRPAQLAEAPTELLERASGGVLWLPDLASLARLEARGLGILANRCSSAGVRLAVCSSADPARLLADGRIDAPLLAALGPGRVDVPPLSDAAHRVTDLAGALLEHVARERSRPIPLLSPEAGTALESAVFPGDFVELRALLERLLLQGEAAVDWHALSVAEPAAPPADAATTSAWFEQPLREARDAFEKAYFQHHLQRLDGQVAVLAEFVGLERTHLYRKLKQLGIRNKDGEA